MKWLKVTIDTSADAVDALSYELTGLGTGGIEIVDPAEIYREINNASSIELFEDKLHKMTENDIVKVSAYFHEDIDKKTISGKVKKSLAHISQYIDTGLASITFSYVNEEDWANNWKKYFKPLEIANNIIICPTWEKFEAETGQKIININPGMAFGTGMHETTKLCAKIIMENSTSGINAADIGCGSGILSLIFSLTGASEVHAVDIDEIAVNSAKDNIKMNECGSKVKVRKGSTNILKNEFYDIIAANIITDVILDIGGQVKSKIKPGGLFITSGIVKARAEQVKSNYQNLGFEEIKTEIMGEWAGILFKLRDFSQINKT